MVTIGTDSYVSEAELTAYATARGLTITANTTVLLIKAMDYIDSRVFVGYKTVSTQALQFPRVLPDYITYPSDTVPLAIKNAQCVAALLIDSGEDLQATMSQAVKREKVDVIEVEYQDGTTSYKQFTALNDLLRPFVNTSYFGVRV